MKKLEQNEIVTHETARRDDTNCPPTNPSINFVDKEIFWGKFAIILFLYTLPRKVTYRKSKIAGVISEVKNIPLS